MKKKQEYFYYEARDINGHLLFQDQLVTHTSITGSKGRIHNPITMSEDNQILVDWIDGTWGRGEQYALPERLQVLETRIGPPLEEEPTIETIEI
jgi:hypothetical protein